MIIYKHIGTFKCYFFAFSFFIYVYTPIEMGFGRSILGTKPLLVLHVVLSKDNSLNTQDFSYAVIQLDHLHVFFQVCGDGMSSTGQKLAAHCIKFEMVPGHGYNVDMSVTVHKLFSSQSYPVQNVTQPQPVTGARTGSRCPRRHRPQHLSERRRRCRILYRQNLNRMQNREISMVTEDGHYSHR